MSDDKKVSIDDLLSIMTMLRNDEHGCPWDRKQTFKTIAPHTLEEVYEVVDTIERDDLDHLPNELGDLLFQVVFYAELGREQGLFEFSDVVNEIGTKLLTRHPHVFPDSSMESFGNPESISAELVEGNWEQIKQSERQEKAGNEVSILDDIPLALPALSRSRKLQKRAATAGFDWPDSQGVLAKVHEELGELEAAMDSKNNNHIEEELGDLFFSLVNLSRHLGMEPESSLRKASRKFEKRFRQLELTLRKEGVEIQEMSLEEMEQVWQQVKKDEST